ncbi:MAG: orotate phosphoribosyltransferase [Halobacteriovoraceae bacterium]|nr:orotate phosphoribosyltransferase [Halobacteriovoraceae bacterium]
MKEKTAEILLEIGAVEVRPSQPFSYASGLKGPIYCDNRKLLSYPSQRKKIAEFFVEKINSLGLEFDQLAGLATAGIPHAAFVAHLMEKPMVYIRSKPKAHGRRNQVEGDAKAGQSLLLIEDLINQGASLNEALLGVKEADLKPISCLAIVSYQTENSKAVSKEWDLPLHSLTDFDALCDQALKMGKINENEKALLHSWRDDPKGWSDKHSV